MKVRFERVYVCVCVCVCVFVSAFLFVSKVSVPTRVCLGWAHNRKPVTQRPSAQCSKPEVPSVRHISPPPRQRDVRDETDSGTAAADAATAAAFPFAM